jgi:hypothetical protein
LNLIYAVWDAFFPFFITFCFSLRLGCSPFFRPGDLPRSLGISLEGSIVLIIRGKSLKTSVGEAKDVLYFERFREHYLNLKFVQILLI